MKIKAREGGHIIDLSEEGARTLVEAGIYDMVEPTKKDTPKNPATPKKTAPEKSTKVEPMTTEDMPSPTKKVK